MKLINTFITLCLLISITFAADTTIVFQKASYQEIFELAEKEQKRVFLYFHFDGCGACKKMEKTAFVDQEVADFFNENFISFDVNTQKGEGIETNKNYNVKMHPTFLFLDDKGTILHKIVGLFSPEEFLVQAQTALNSTQTLASLKEQYHQGKREARFLLEYCYALRNANELDSMLINQYLNTQSVEELGQEHNIRFIYEFALHNFEVTTPFGSKAFQFLLRNKDRFYKYFEPDQVDTRIVWIVNECVYQAIARQDEELFNYALEVLDDFDNGNMYLFKEMDGRLTGMITGNNLVLSSKMAYYEKAGDTGKYQEALNAYIDKNWTDSDALNTLAWDYYKKYDDEDHLVLAKKWVARSIELKSTHANHDTYAALLYKLGEYEAALNQAETAISIAKTNRMNYRETERLIEKIKASLKR